MGFWHHDPSGTLMEEYYKKMKAAYDLHDFPQSFVDIVTPNAGGERMARGTYEALCKHGQSINWRLFPISQGEFGAHDFWVKTAAHDERVFPILNDWNKPVPHAYNQAYLMSMAFPNPSPFIFTMDDDTRLVRDDWLQYLLWLRNTYDNPDELAVVTYGSSAIGRKPPTDGPWLENDVGWDSNLLARPAFDAVGLADENYCWHFGDSDLCRRMTLHRGFKILLGKQQNKWRVHIGRVGSSQLGYKEAWWRGMSIQVGGLKWANMPVKGVGSELGVDKVRSMSYDYPMEGWWRDGCDFEVFCHQELGDLNKDTQFPFKIDETHSQSNEDKLADVNLIAYKVYRKDNPEHARHYDPVVAKLYGVEGSVEDFLQDVPEGF